MASVAAINLYYLIPGGYRHAYDDGWLNEEYKTITITSKLSEVTNGDALLAWLQANATKQSTTAPTLISFTIAGTSYQAEEGMTWEEWVNSGYNTGGYIVSGDSIYKPSGRQGFVYDNIVMSDVKVTDTIISSRAYIVQTGGSSGN